MAADAGEDAVVDYADAVAEDVCFFHRVSRQHHGSVAFLLAVLKDVPKLSSRLWVQASCWLIQEDDLGARDDADCDRQTSSHAQG